MEWLTVSFILGLFIGLALGSLALSRSNPLMRATTPPKLSEDSWLGYIYRYIGKLHALEYMRMIKWPVSELPTTVKERERERRQRLYELAVGMSEGLKTEPLPPPPPLPDPNVSPANRQARERI